MTNRACTLLAAFVLGCSARTAPAPTGILVDISSELAVADASSLQIRVLSDNAAVFVEYYELGASGGLRLPTSLAIAPKGESYPRTGSLPPGVVTVPNGPVTIEAIARAGTDASAPPTLVRRATLSFVEHRVVSLPLRLEKACVGVTACDEKSTCTAGTCASATVDANLLADAP